ncbi:MAG: hypothetical protein H6766_07190 [Candidatus Peribacteria bacterium]|nr:MAG: hypothetical protein H6766_07190 [Candidatus Peribacteria bacterium]
MSGTVNVADNLIRESHINQTTITSPTAQWSTYYNPTDSSSLSVVPHNMIAPSAVLTALQTE